ncbi:hypothetical protein BGZ95_001418 [Linnemannia exigua]|uniref:Uncharacterized protein n=1 Tax=Linnemannia exigua TaxID=604196 RepID=A0AAD4D6X4_9FUNG|nr:hypothetical protein BGZ95_001418 [Linnemannia exigua]
MAEHLLGPKFWKLNGLPNMTLRYKIIKQFFLYLMSLDLWLATKFARWFLFRRASILKIEGLIIRYVLGRKKTRYALKEVPKEGVEALLDGKVKKGSAALHEVMRYRAEEAAAAAGKGWIWPKALTVASAAIGIGMSYT